MYLLDRLSLLSILSSIEIGFPFHNEVATGFTLKLAPISYVEAFIRLRAFSFDLFSIIFSFLDWIAMDLDVGCLPARNAVSVSPEAAKPFSTALNSCQIICCECAHPVSHVRMHRWRQLPTR